MKMVNDFLIFFNETNKNVSLVAIAPRDLRSRHLSRTHTSNCNLSYFKLKYYYNNAAVVKLVYTQHSKCCGGNPMSVRVRPAAFKYAQGKTTSQNICMDG